MGKIGDLFVRLGLKKDDYSKGLQEAKREGASFGESLRAIGSKAKIAFAVAAAAVVGVIKALKDLGQQNQTLGDEIARTSAGLQAMWDTMKTSLASLDFSNLLNNLREANKLARDLYDAQDAMGEIGTAYNMSLARQLEHINKLKIALRDQNLSDEERIKAGEELLSIYKKLEQNPSRGLERVKDNTLDYYMQRMGVVMDGRTDQEMASLRKKYASFFEWLGTAQGEAYNSAAAKVAKAFGGIDSERGQVYLRNAANNGQAEFARLAVAYNDKIGEKDRAKIEQAVVAYYQQEAKYSGETLRIQTQINSIRAQGSREAASGGETAADQQMKQAEAVLRRAQDSAKGELQILSEKYDAEKKLLEQYGLDTDALWKEYQRNVEKALDVKLPDLKLGIDLEIDDIDMSEVDSEIQTAIDHILTEMERMQDLVNEFSEAVVAGFSDACQELAEQVFGLSEINTGAVFQALLTPLADMAIKAGEIIMAEGLATEAAKSALETFGETGWGAVVAGAALVAAGAAAKAGLAALAKSGGRSTSASTYSGSSGGSNQLRDYQTELTVNVKGTIRGSDIVISGQKTVNSWGR